MTWASARAAIDLLLAPAPAGVRLCFTGGEPLLATPLVRRCVEYARSRAAGATVVDVVVSTNGTLLGAETAAFLAGHDVTLQVSFDGDGQELRAPGTGPAVERSLRALAESHPGWFSRRVRVAVTLTPANLDRLAGTVDRQIALGVPEVSIAAASGLSWPEPGTLEAALDAQLERVAASCAALVRQGRDHPVSLLRDPKPRPLPDETEAWCAAGSATSFGVDPCGVAWGCPAFSDSIQRLSPLGREAAAALRLGNVRDPSVPGRLSALPARAADVRSLSHRRRKRSPLADCGRCPHLGSCTPCPAAGAREPSNEDPDLVPAAFCALTRAAARARATMPRPLSSLLRDLAALGARLGVRS